MISNLMPHVHILVVPAVSYRPPFALNLSKTDSLLLHLVSIPLDEGSPTNTQPPLLNLFKVLIPDIIAVRRNIWSIETNFIEERCWVPCYFPDHMTHPIYNLQTSSKVALETAITAQTLLLYNFIRLVNTEQGI